MQNMNICIFTGRMGQDAKITYSASNMAIARFSLAVNSYSKKDGEITRWINFIAFGKTAETLEKFGKKGTQLAIQSEFVPSSFNGKDGNKVYTNDFMVQRLEFLGAKANSQKADANAEFVEVPEGAGDTLPFM